MEPDMPTRKRVKTKYPGVFYIESTSPATGKPEKIFYIQYRKNGKLVEEKAGRQYQDDMTASRAATLRGDRMEGRQPTNNERREADKAAKEAEAGRWSLDRIWVEYKAQRSRNKGLTVDDSRYAKYLSVGFGKKTPAEISQQDVDNLKKRLDASLHPQTVKHILALLKRIVTFGAKKGFCAVFPFIIDMPAFDNEKTEDLSSDQLAKLLKAIDDEPHKDIARIMKLALYTGMRKGEILHLEWRDIDFERGFITIRAETAKGERTSRIPMNDGARAIILAQDKTDSSLVFPGPVGKVRSDIRRPINRIRKRAELPKDFRPMHGLRHVYASMMASSGKVDLYELQKLLTHRTPRMTQRYAHLRDEALKRASSVADDLIEKTLATNSDKKHED